MRALCLLALIWLASCASTGSAPDAAATQESGFSNFCAAHRGVGVCPP